MNRFLRTPEATFIIMYFAILILSLLPGRGIGVAFLAPILLAGYVWLRWADGVVGFINGLRSRNVVVKDRVTEEKPKYKQTNF